MQQRYDIALIDDDKLIRLAWDFAARRKGLRLLAVANLEALLEHRESLSESVPIYIDVKLGENVRGEHVAKDLADEGYAELYLTTGYSTATINKPDCVRAVVGKDPPWTLT